MSHSSCRAQIGLVVSTARRTTWAVAWNLIHTNFLTFLTKQKKNLQGCFNSNHMGSSMKSYTHEFLDMFSWNKKNNLQSSLTYKKNQETLFRYWKAYLLCVPAICHRFVLIILQNYVAKLWIRHILDNVPFYWKETIPLVLLPEVHVPVKI